MALDPNILKSSYNRLGIELSRGTLSADQLRHYYSKARKRALDAVRRIQKSDVAFIGEPPVFRKLKNLTTDRDLISEIVDVNRFLNSAYSKIGSRRVARARSLETLKRHGMGFIDECNYSNWARFMRWFHAAGLQLFMDSEGSAAEELFEDVKGLSPEEWEQAYILFLSRE